MVPVPLFSELVDAEKSRWAGTGTMYEFQRRVNPTSAREVLNDKRKFYKAYRQFFRHALYDRDELAADPTKVRDLLSRNERLVFKDATGNCGASIVHSGVLRARSGNYGRPDEGDRSRYGRELCPAT